MLVLVVLKYVCWSDESTLSNGSGHKYPGINFCYMQILLEIILGLFPRSVLKASD